MKLRYVFAALVLAGAAGALMFIAAGELRAASSRMALLEKPQLQSMSIVPLVGEDGKLQSLHVTAKYLVLHLNPDGRTRQKHIFSVDLDLAMQAKEQVIVGDEIVVLGDLRDDLMTLSDAMWQQRFPSPLPTVRRRAVREKVESVQQP